MMLGQVLRFIKDVCLCVNFEAGVGQSKSSRDLADTDDWRPSIVRRPQRLFPEFGAKRYAVFVQDVAQPLSHTGRASQQSHFPSCRMRLPDSLGHIFRAAVKFFDRLSLYKER